MRIIRTEGHRPTIYVENRDYGQRWRESPLQFRSLAEARHYAKRLEPLVHRVRIVVVAKCAEVAA